MPSLDFSVNFEQSGSYEENGRHSNHNIKAEWSFIYVLRSVVKVQNTDLIGIFLQ